MSVGTVVNFFENVFDYKYFILSIGCLFILVLGICSVLMATVSNLARVRRGHKRALKFFSWNSVLFETNKDLFYKKVVRVLPIAVRKQWRTASKYYEDYCSVGFRNLLTESIRTGGNTTFVGYVAVFIAGLIVIIVSAMLMGGNTGEYAPMMSFTVAGGAGGLLLLATELYFLDKFADKHGDEFVTAVSSRLLRKAETQEDDLPLGNDFYKSFKPSEAISLGMNLNQRMQNLKQVEANINLNNEEFNEYFNDGIVDESIEAKFEDIEDIYELSEADNVFENNDIIDKCPAVDEGKSAQLPRKEFELPIAGAKDIVIKSQQESKPLVRYAETDAIKDMYRHDRHISENELTDSEPKQVECLANKKAEDFETLNKLLDYEERLNAMQNVNKIIKESKNSPDSIGKLEKLINGIVADGVSDSLLRDVYSALNEIDSYDYNNPLDKVRVKCLIRRLENAI